MSVGALYFIQAGSGGFVKIGWSNKPEGRLPTLQCGNPIQLTIVRTVPHAGRKAEAWAHRKFAEFWVRGEWFRFTEEMLSWIPVRIDPPPKPKRLLAIKPKYAPIMPGPVNVRKIRDHLNLSRQELADKVGCTERTVRAWEEKTRNPLGAARTVLKQLAAAAAEQV